MFTNECAHNSHKFANYSQSSHQFTTVNMRYIHSSIVISAPVRASQRSLAHLSQLDEARSTHPVASETADGKVLVDRSLDVPAHTPTLQAAAGVVGRTEFIRTASVQPKEHLCLRSACRRFW
jgi:hypothetical protein